MGSSRQGAYTVPCEGQWGQVGKGKIPHIVKVESMGSSRQGATNIPCEGQCTLAIGSTLTLCNEMWVTRVI